MKPISTIFNRSTESKLLMPWRTLNRGLELTISRQFGTLSTATLNYKINESLQNGRLDAARRLFDENPTSRNTVSWNMMLKGYIQNSRLNYAQVLFDEMPLRDIVSWNTLLSGLQKERGDSINGLYRGYLELRRSRIQPNDYTFSIVITAVLGSVFDVLIPQFHAQIVCMGLNSSVFVGSALMKAYTAMRDRHALTRVFDEVLGKNVTSWNALIYGFMELGLTSEAERAFSVMSEKNVISWTTMVNGYLKNNQIGRARYLFNKMDDKNVVTWTAMIHGYVQGSLCSTALELFVSMMESGTRPNQLTFSTVLDACAGFSSLPMGQQIHASIINHCIIPLLDVILSTALVDMYAKCGDINTAFYIFEYSIPEKNTTTWNVLIGGYALHGMPTRAIEEFHRMQRRSSNNLMPNHVTFVNVLLACVHGGLVDEGERIFHFMESVCNVEPRKEHYACMVDLYGRAGLLHKAESVIIGMPFKPDVVIWGALLGACGLHANIVIGEHAADAIHLLERDHPAIYTMLSKILGEKGVWSAVIDLRNSMKEKLAKKQKAGSWIS
ncbi:hypothetical protein Dimus_032522 [Dionaea muscipula]